MPVDGTQVRPEIEVKGEGLAASLHRAFEWSLASMDEHMALEARAFEERLATLRPRAGEQFAALCHGSLALQRLLCIMTSELSLAREEAGGVRAPTPYRQLLPPDQLYLHLPPLPRPGAFATTVVFVCISHRLKFFAIPDD